MFKLPALGLLAKVSIIGGLLVVTALTAAWQLEARRADKLQAQVIKWQREFAKLSNKRNEQREVTKTRIIEVERKAKDADSRAKRIEAAPLPGNCQTPREILGAGL